MINSGAATGTCRYCRKPIEFLRNYWRHNYSGWLGLRACDDQITCLGGLEAAPTVSDPKRYEIVSLYDLRIIRRNLTHAEAWEFSRDMNRLTEHGVKIVQQR